MFFFFFNDTATTEIYTLSLHDALPIFLSSQGIRRRLRHHGRLRLRSAFLHCGRNRDRKSTRLNSSHSQISYAVFCLKKKKIRSYNSSNSRPFTDVYGRKTCTTKLINEY